ncbi:MAG: Fic family protein, partial [Bacteroidales bacterium]|nr:Fic family protein [Bacteroidales bacterium]
YVPENVYFCKKFVGMLPNDKNIALQTLIAQYRDQTKNVLDLERLSMYAITYHSTAIEGSSLTESEVVNLLDINKPARNKDFRDNLMVFDHYNAMLFVHENALEKRKISEDFIKQISALVMKNTGKEYNTVYGSFDSGQGEYRLLNVHAGTRRFPDSTKVSSLMAEFVDYINAEMSKKDVDPIMLAFDAHFRLVGIHPFADGNGRVSRLIMNYILAYYGLPMFMVCKQDRLKYIDALESARNSENMEPFYDFMYKQYIKFLKKEIKDCK